MKKYIHYCWFGGKPLPKLAKKCIKSWEKYLPDYKIIEWNESNVDLNECPFVKEAYENKKWAFVADYVRTKVMYEMGGIYFDTDMEVTKSIDELINKNESFLGVEDSHMIACGVWYEPEPYSYLSKELLDFYQSQSFFDIDNLYTISIPRIISNILTDFDTSKLTIQHLNHNITIYPRDYFYPLSYNHQFNVFTENTCMIHYYDASWTPKYEQRENKIYRLLGKKNGTRFIKLVSKSKKIIKKGIKLLLYPIIIYKRKKSKITKKYLEDLNNTLLSLKNIKSNKVKYVAFVNPNWLGVTNATKELFENVIPCSELLRSKDIKKVYNEIIEANIKEVIFSGFCIGWKDLVKKLHQANVIVKTYYHGSHSQVLEPYGWKRNMEIYELSKKGILDEMATCKASLVNFYKDKGCKIKFLRNRVILPKNLKIKRQNNEKNILRVGIYAAKTEDFRKNVFSQIASLTQLNKEVIIDMVPINKKAQEFAKKIGIKIEGIDHPVPREELLQHMANCDIVLYTTFSECAPMLPLESFAVGTPCITGNNHHYFKNEELEKYIVVDNECNLQEISTKIELCLKNKEKILNLYKVWEKNNNHLSIEGVNEYIRVGGETNEK